VTALVKSTGADAVLVTRLVNQDVSVKEKRGGTVVKLDDYKSDLSYGDPYAYNVYSYDFTVTLEPSSLVIKRKASVTTDLFETGEGKVLYTIRSDVRVTNSESLDQNTDVAVMDTLAADLAGRLRRDGAVR
jgi:repressor of nif and glnA expression